MTRMTFIIAVGTLVIGCSHPHGGLALPVAVIAAPLAIPAIHLHDAVKRISAEDQS